MKRVTVIGVSVLAILIFATFSFAEGPKLGFLDLSKTFDEYVKTKEYDGVLAKKNETYEAERNKKIDKLKEVQGKLALIKEEEKEKVQKEFEDLRAELLAYDQEQRTDLGQQRNEKVREILLDIEQVVSEIAKKEKYDFVFNDRVLIYGNEALDISERVIKQLNDNYNKQGTAPKAAAPAQP